MIKLAFRYISYKLFAPHRKGFGLHSPFVFHLVSNVLMRKNDKVLQQISDWRKELSHDKSIIRTSNHGAGSKAHKRKDRKVSRIARKSSITHKYGRVIYSLVKEFKPATIIEMGTGIGVSTIYLAKACSQSRIFSIEGDKGKIEFAAKNIEQNGIKNVALKNGYFKDSLTGILKEVAHPVIIFVDGDHSYEKTIEYFKELKNYKDENTIMIFDDIRWSPDMERAWSSIKSDNEVVLSIDLFFMGIVFFRRGMTKQDFVINF